MIIYKDIFSGDELFSDSYTLKLIDDVVYQVEGKTISISNDVDDSAIGGNASADGGAEEIDPSYERGINIVLAHRLVETSFNKKSYQLYIKGYVKRVLDKIEGSERAGVFKAKIQGFMKGVMGEFKEYAFYLGESLDEDGMVVLMKYPDESTVPYFYFFKDGLVPEKF